MKKAFKALREYFREESMTELLIKLICALCISTMLIFIIMGCSQKTSICENADKTEHKRICNTYNNNEDDALNANENKIVLPENLISIDKDDDTILKENAYSPSKTERKMYLSVENEKGFSNNSNEYNSYKFWNLVELLGIGILFGFV